MILKGTTAQLRRALPAFLARPGVLTDGDIWHRSTVGEAPMALDTTDNACYTATGWPQADRLFRQDPRWAGGEVASTVDLGGGRILWLFGDSHIDTTGGGHQYKGPRVHSSLAVQRGTDPTTATMSFVWGKDSAGKPASLIPDRGLEWSTPLGGIRLDDRVILFLRRTYLDPGQWREDLGWHAAMVENPDDEPAAWRIRPLAFTAHSQGVTLGTAGVLRKDGFIYAFGSLEQVSSTPIFVARWREEKVRRGDLAGPEWWGGRRAGWIADTSELPRHPLFEAGQPGVSIFEDSVTNRFVALQSGPSRDGDPKDVVVRAARSLTGEWTDGRSIFRPPFGNVGAEDAHVHHGLSGADLVTTYDPRTGWGGGRVPNDGNFYPQFIRITRCR